MTSALSRYGNGALLMTQLNALAPGHSFRIPNAALMDCQVPADPLDRQDGPYLAEAFRSRLPFYCTAEQRTDNGDWVFHRPMPPYNASKTQWR